MNSTGPQRFAAANWDILVDFPIETGIDRSYRFTEGGRDYEVVFWGDGNFDPQAVADIRKIVPQATSIWSGYPFQRYVFMIHATDGVGGATEHRNSTVIQIPRWSFQPRDKYLGFLSTTAHEFIHTWNVKYYRERGDGPVQLPERELHRPAVAGGRIDRIFRRSVPAARGPDEARRIFRGVCPS